VYFCVCRSRVELVGGTGHLFAWGEGAALKVDLNSLLLRSSASPSCGRADFFFAALPSRRMTRVTESPRKCLCCAVCEICALGHPDTEVLQD